MRTLAIMVQTPGTQLLTCCFQSHFLVHSQLFNCFDPDGINPSGQILEHTDPALFPFEQSHFMAMPALISSLFSGISAGQELS